MGPSHTTPMLETPLNPPGSTPECWMAEDHTRVSVALKSHEAEHQDTQNSSVSAFGDDSGDWKIWSLCRIVSHFDPSGEELWGIRFWGPGTEQQYTKIYVGG